MEQQINRYITLKLQEDGKTIIYVNGKQFLQCMKLFVDLPSGIIYEMNDDVSIDVIAEKYKYGDSSKYNITHEEEFYAHCSNLQAWSEMNYNTNILHSNIAFPLLKELTHVGDPLAKRMFKEEIVKKFEKGKYPSTMIYLLNEKYLDYLDNEQFIDVIVNNGDLLGDAPFTSIAGTRTITPLRIKSWDHDVAAIILDMLINRGLLTNKRVSEILIKLCKANIIHKNMATFELLKKMDEAGNSEAREVLIKEIKKSFEKGEPQEPMYKLLNEGYLNILDNEDFIDIIEKNDDLLRNGQWVGDIAPLRFWVLSHYNAPQNTQVGQYILSELIDRNLINNNRVKKILTDLVKVSDPSRQSQDLEYDLGQLLSDGLFSEDIKELDAEVIDLLSYNQEFISCVRSYIRDNNHTKSLVKVYKEIIIRRLNQKDYEAIRLLNIHMDLHDAERNILFDTKSIEIWAPDELFNLIFPILPELLKEGSVSGYYNLSKKIFTISVLKELNKYNKYPSLKKYLKNTKSACN